MSTRIRAFLGAALELGFHRRRQYPSSRYVPAIPAAPLQAVDLDAQIGELREERRRAWLRRAWEGQG